jgi:hypothetical protein
LENINKLSRLKKMAKKIVSLERTFKIISKILLQNYHILLDSWNILTEFQWQAMSCPPSWIIEDMSQSDDAIAICDHRKPYFIRPKKICGFPVSRPYLAFGRRNPDSKLFYWIMLVSVST